MSVHFENCFATSKPLFSFHMKYEIKLNLIAFSYPGINDKIQNTYDSNYRSIKSIIYHEIGHVLQLFYICYIYKLDFRHVNYFRIVWLSTKHDILMKKYFQSHNILLTFTQSQNWSLSMMCRKNTAPNALRSCRNSLNSSAWSQRSRAV